MSQDRNVPRSAAGGVPTIQVDSATFRAGDDSTLSFDKSDLGAVADDCVATSNPHEGGSGGALPSPGYEFPTASEKTTSNSGAGGASEALSPNSVNLSSKSRANSKSGHLDGEERESHLNLSTQQRPSWSHCSDGTLTPLTAYGHPARTASFLNLMMVPIPTELCEESLFDLLRLPSPQLNRAPTIASSGDEMSSASLGRKASGSQTLAPLSGARIACSLQTPQPDEPEKTQPGPELQFRGALLPDAEVPADHRSRSLLSVADGDNGCHPGGIDDPNDPKSSQQPAPVAPLVDVITTFFLDEFVRRLAIATTCMEQFGQQWGSHADFRWRQPSCRTAVAFDTSTDAHDDGCPFSASHSSNHQSTIVIHTPPAAALGNDGTLTANRAAEAQWVHGPQPLDISTPLRVAAVSNRTAINKHHSSIEKCCPCSVILKEVMDESFVIAFDVIFNMFNQYDDTMLRPWVVGDAYNDSSVGNSSTRTAPEGRLSLNSPSAISTRKASASVTTASGQPHTSQGSSSDVLEWSRKTKTPVGEATPNTNGSEPLDGGSSVPVPLLELSAPQQHEAASERPGASSLPDLGRLLSDEERIAVASTIRLAGLALTMRAFHHTVNSFVAFRPPSGLSPIRGDPYSPTREFNRFNPLTDKPDIPTPLAHFQRTPFSLWRRAVMETFILLVPNLWFPEGNMANSTSYSVRSAFLERSFGLTSKFLHASTSSIKGSFSRDVSGESQTFGTSSHEMQSMNLFYVANMLLRVEEAEEENRNTILSAFALHTESVEAMNPLRLIAMFQKRESALTSNLATYLRNQRPSLMMSEDVRLPSVEDELTLSSTHSGSSRQNSASLSSQLSGNNLLIIRALQASKSDMGKVRTPLAALTMSLFHSKTQDSDESSTGSAASPAQAVISDFESTVHTSDPPLFVDEAFDNDSSYTSSGQRGSVAPSFASMTPGAHSTLPTFLIPNPSAPSAAPDLEGVLSTTTHKERSFFELNSYFTIGPPSTSSNKDACTQTDGCAKDCDVQTDNVVVLVPAQYDELLAASAKKTEAASILHNPVAPPTLAVKPIGVPYQPQAPSHSSAGNTAPRAALRPTAPRLPLAVTTTKGTPLQGRGPKGMLNSQDFVAALFRLRHTVANDFIQKERDERDTTEQMEATLWRTLFNARHSPRLLADFRLFEFLHPQSAGCSEGEDAVRGAIAMEEAVARSNNLERHFVTLCAIWEEFANRCVILEAERDDFLKLRGLLMDLMDLHGASRIVVAAEDTEDDEAILEPIEQRCEAAHPVVNGEMAVDESTKQPEVLQQARDALIEEFCALCDRDWSEWLQGRDAIVRARMKDFLVVVHKDRQLIAAMHFQIECSRLLESEEDDRGALRFNEEALFEQIRLGGEFSRARAYHRAHTRESIEQIEALSSQEGSERALIINNEEREALSIQEATSCTPTSEGSNNAFAMSGIMDNSTQQAMASSRKRLSWALEESSGSISKPRPAPRRAYPPTDTGLQLSPMLPSTFSKSTPEVATLSPQQCTPNKHSSSAHSTDSTGAGVSVYFGLDEAPPTSFVEAWKIFTIHMRRIQADVASVSPQRKALRNLSPTSSQSGESGWTVSKITLPNGGVFEGQMKATQFDGIGMYSYPAPAPSASIFERDLYLGNWKMNSRHGEGIYAYTSRRVRDTSQPDGSPSHNNANTRTLIEHGQCDLYLGEWRRDQRHGEGFFVRAPSSTSRSPGSSSPHGGTLHMSTSTSQTVIMFGDWVEDKLSRLRWMFAAEGPLPQIAE